MTGNMVETWSLCVCGPGWMARAIRRGQRHSPGPAAAARRDQTQQPWERRHRDQTEEPPASAGGGRAERLQGGGWERGPHEERTQDATGCEQSRIP